MSLGTSRVLTCTYVGDDRENGHPIEDLLPGTNAVSLGCHGTPELSGELPGVNANLDNVVEQRQQRCQREGGDKQSDEAKLDHWSINKGERSVTCCIYRSSVHELGSGTPTFSGFTHFQVLLEEAQLSKAL